ncbi:MAG: hypothetical protein U1A27_05310 [Phycisphaerae bacterium]
MASPSAWTPALNDEGTLVSPHDGMRLVLIPFRYRDDVEVDLRRGSIDLRANPGGSVRFLGLQSLQVQDGRPTLPHAGNEPLYERLQVIPRAGRAPTVVAHNLLRPNPASAERDRSRRVGTIRNRLTGSGMGVAVFEVPAGSNSLTLTMASGAPEQIRMSVLEGASRPLEGSAGPDSPAAQAWLRCLSEDSPTSAALALLKLGEALRSVAAEQRDAWRGRVDPVLLVAISRPEPSVRNAAWTALIDQANLPEATLAALVRAGDAVIRPVLELTAAAFANPQLPSGQRRSAIQVFAALLRSEQPAHAEAALELLFSGAPDEAYAALADATAATRATALQRCAGMVPPPVRTRVLRALLLRATPAETERIGEMLGRDQMVLSDPGDKLLDELLASRGSARAAKLAALRAMSWLPILGTERVVRLLDEGAADASNAALRDEIFALAAEQAVRRSGDAAHGSFPALMSERDDVILRVLNRGVGAAGADDLPDLVAARIRVGDVFGLAELLRARFAAAPELLDLMRRIARREGAERLDALYALLARLASQPGATTRDTGRAGRRQLLDFARGLFTLLDELAARRGAAAAPRVGLAIKAGLDWPGLADYSACEDADLSARATRWMLRLSHASPQDARQLVAAGDKNGRIDRLANTNNRRGRIVIGRYRVMALAELAVPIVREESGDLVTWEPPRRITLDGGMVEMRSRDLNREFQIYHGDTLLGFGTPAAEAVSLPLPEQWVPQLVPADPGFTLPGRPLHEFSSAPPLLLASAEESPGRSASMRVAATELLREALQTDAGAAALAQQADQIVPPNLSVTIRYAGFGTYVGVGSRAQTAGRTATTRPQANVPVLVNLAILLERIEPEAAPPGT